MAVTDSSVRPGEAEDRPPPFGHHPLGTLARMAWWLSNHRWFPASTRRILRKRLAANWPGPFDVAIELGEGKALRLRAWPTQNYCDRVVVSRMDLPEKAEHEALRPLVNPGCVFVDIGANVGSYSVFVGALAEKNTTLIAMEPHPDTYRKLRVNLVLNDLPLTHAHNCGVAQETGTLPLYSDGGSNIGHTSMLREGTANPARSVEVPVRPLLDIVGDAGVERIDILKIDIEGFEDRALYPFLTAAPSHLLPRHILIETAHNHLWQYDLEAKLIALGYLTTFETAENRLLSLPS